MSAAWHEWGPGGGAAPCLRDGSGGGVAADGDDASASTTDGGRPAPAPDSDAASVPSCHSERTVLDEEDALLAAAQLAARQPPQPARAAPPT